MVLRKPIVTIMGHVDHGKTKILDTIRSTTVVDREAGAITQAIGASIVPLDTIRRICGPLLEKLKTRITLPGLLFIDTPGHAAFTNLRRRGGNLADIAIIVIDINEGPKPQTLEALEIMRSYKTPFVVVLNKIDLISGWHRRDALLIKDMDLQSEPVRTIFDTKLYEVVGRLHELGFKSERFDRIEDHTKQVALVPTSAITGEGIAELLMVLTGLAQKFLNECLQCDVSGPARGTILEVKEEKGLGTTLDVIIYDGKIRINDLILIAGTEKPIRTKVRALLEPNPLAEMRDKKSRFRPVKEAEAATGVKIAAPELSGALAGMPLMVTFPERVEKDSEDIQKEIEEVVFETGRDGIIIKADSLGSLEAMITLLKEKGIAIRKAQVGNITKSDISDAESNYDKDPLQALILGFNVEMTPDVTDMLKGTHVKVLTNTVIYRLLEDFNTWMDAEKKARELEKMSCVSRPFKLQGMKGYVFRQCNPAVFGVEVVEGILVANRPLMKADGSKLSTVKAIQSEQKSVEKAERNRQVAVSVDGITIGRQMSEGEVLYSELTEEEFRQLKGCKHLLPHPEVELLKEIAEIKRKQNPLWGV